MPTVLAVASRSPTKLGAVRDAAQLALPGCPVVGVDVESGVARQPLGMAAVRQGAVTRALGAARARPAAWGVGLENGLVSRAGRLYAVGWCAVSDGRTVLGASAAPEYVLPRALAEAVREGLRTGGSLAEAAARVCGGSADHWATAGTVAALTGGAVTRKDLWRIPVVLALSAAAWRAGLRLPERSGPPS